MSTNRNFAFPRRTLRISLSLSSFIHRRRAHIFCLFIFSPTRKCQFRSKDIGFYECRLALRQELRGAQLPVPRRYFYLETWSFITSIFAMQIFLAWTLDKCVGLLLFLVHKKAFLQKYISVEKGIVTYKV